MERSKRTVIIIAHRGMGDLVFHTRAIRALARKSASGRVSLFARDGANAEALFSGDPAIEQIVSVDERTHRSVFCPFRVANLLRPHDFQEAWVLSRAAMRYTTAAALAGIPERMGYGTGYARFLLKKPVLSQSSFRLSVIARYEELMRAYGVCLCDEDHFLVPDPVCAEAYRRQFSAIPRPWIAIGFGCGPFDRRRQWPEDRFAELTHILSQRGGVFLVGAPDQRAQAEGIREQAGGQATIVADSSMRGAAAFLSVCDAFIGNDGGVLNVAAALKVPSIGIFRVLGPQPYSLSVMKQTTEAYRKKNGRIDDILSAEVLDVVSHNLLKVS